MSNDKMLDGEIEMHLENLGFKHNVEEGRLMLLELIVKAQAGCYNSHTQELFLSRMRVLNKDRRPNACGRYFLRDMLYKHSNKRAPIYELILKYRRD